MFFSGSIYVFLFCNPLNGFIDCNILPTLLPLHKGPHNPFDLYSISGKENLNKANISTDY